MIRIVEWAIANSLTVAVLAPIVFLVGHVCRQPAVRHGLWVLLLIKLVTPPLFPVEISLPDLLPSRAAATSASAVPSPQVVRSVSETVALPSPPASLPIASVAVETATVPQSVPSAFEPVGAGSTAVIAEAAPIAPVLSADPAVPASPSVVGPLVARTLVFVWLTGAAILLSVQLYRLASFARRLRRSSYPSAGLDDDMQEVLDGLGCTRAPRVLMVNGVVSPMLWGVGRWATILFPAELYQQLRRDARQTLLLHELAHYHRGDSWVRLLEFVNVILFWWHPVAWWSLREIESAEEECCDQWVMGRTPSSARCYAGALLDTIDFLCERNPLAPPVSSGLGNPRELRGRLVKIMQGSGRQTINAAGRVGLALVLLGLPFQPQALASLGGSFRETLLSGLERIESLAPTDPETEIPTVVATRSAVTEPAIPAPQVRPTAPRSRSSVREWATAVSDGGRYEIRARTGKRVDLIDNETGRATPLTDWNVAATAFVPGRGEFVTGGFDRQLRLWDAASGTIRATFAEFAEAVVSVAVSRDGGLVAAGARSGDVAVYRTGDLVEPLTWKLDAPINSVRFSPAGDRLLVSVGGWRSERSGALVVIDVRGGTILRTIPLARPIGVAEFTADANTVVTGGWDGRIDFVRLPQGNVIASVMRSKDVVSAGAFSQDVESFPGVDLETARAEVARQELERLGLAIGTGSPLPFPSPADAVARTPQTLFPSLFAVAPKSAALRTMAPTSPVPTTTSSAPGAPALLSAPAPR